MREGLQKIVPSGDTIVAIATPFGRSGLGVVRLSGSQVRDLASRFLKTTHAVVHRRAAIGKWIDEAGEALDDVVATFYEAPHSYTGEDVLEISAHGNPLILKAIVGAIQRAGTRIAAPGEFTLRAVTNRKMDLIQAEAVRDFIDAQTGAQARTALKQMGGALSHRVAPIKTCLVDLIARMEAGIDFADDDVAPPDEASVAAGIQAVVRDLEELRKTYGYGMLLANGLRLAIIGKPNVGKSSLFNRLVAADRAIVTAIPGTTRDVLRETAHLDGIPLQFFDTAGLRETTDVVEQIGVTRSLETMSDADLVLAVFDGSAPMDVEDRSVLQRAAGLPASVVVINKCDLPQQINPRELSLSTVVCVSAKTGEGLGALNDALRSFFQCDGSESLSEGILTTARQYESVETAVGALNTAVNALLDRTPHEMVLLDLYRALTALNELTGETVTEDILGRIFSTFCVGK
jgi:tRNA modification GTPase